MEELVARLVKLRLRAGAALEPAPDEKLVAEMDSYSRERAEAAGAEFKGGGLVELHAKMVALTEREAEESVRADMAAVLPPFRMAFLEESCTVAEKLLNGDESVYGDVLVLRGKYHSWTEAQQLRCDQLLGGSAAKSMLLQSCSATPKLEDDDNKFSSLAGIAVPPNEAAARLEEALERLVAGSHSEEERLRCTGVVAGFREGRLALSAKAGSVMVSVEGEALPEVQDFIMSSVRFRSALARAGEAALAHKYPSIRGTALVGELVSARTLPVPGKLAAFSQHRCHPPKATDAVRVAVIRCGAAVDGVGSAIFAAGALRALRAHGGQYSCCGGWGSRWLFTSRCTGPARARAPSSLAGRRRPPTTGPSSSALWCLPRLPTTWRSTS